MRRLITMLAASLILGGCLDEQATSNQQAGARYFAAVATVAPDFSSGAHALIGRDGAMLVAHNDVAPTHSDLTLAAFDGKVYRIERFQGANVTRFDGNAAASLPDWQYSLVAAGETAAQTNPVNMILASAAKAYVVLYGKAKVLIVDPGATSAAAFVTGELDLSAYDDGDGVPDVHNGVIADGKLFLTLQRQTNFVPSNTAYVAVFDVATDTEIDTGRDPGLKGIPLAIRNPDNDIVYVAAENAVYVQAVGKNFDFGTGPPEFTGGIERIDVGSYATRVVVADDDAGATHGHTAAVAVVSSDKGYLVGQADFFTNSLYSFDPASGAVGAAVHPALSAIQITDISLGPDGRLWVSDSSNATVHLLDPASDTIVDAVVTNLNPGQVGFFAAP